MPFRSLHEEKEFSQLDGGGQFWTPIFLLEGQCCTIFHTPTLLRWVLVRDPDGKMEPQAFFCTDTDMDPADVISNFAKRWEMEVTFQEVRTHLGVETPRQWSRKAIARTTPALLGLYSLVCLWAQRALESNRMSYAAAWYEKTNFTFSDAIAAQWATLYRTLDRAKIV